VGNSTSARPATAAPPIIAIDPDAPRSDFHLFAAMTFPLDPCARAEAIAVAAGCALDAIKTHGLRLAVAEVEQALDEAGSKSALMALPHASHIVPAMATAFLEDVQQDFQNVYDGAGGSSTLLRAARKSDVMARMRRAARHSDYVGGALLLTVSMDRHHPDLVPTFPLE
jgi:hypothetical protein